ncbi:MAG: GIY-YIG nuclease family protein [Proteobacteria bacterium]|nr:GIY-YIG nuclease family protein [Pseudomonadota bacterium]
MTVHSAVCQNTWFVYLVRCKDATLYCGIAKNPARHLIEHNSDDKGAKYTRGRRPVQLIYLEEFSSRVQAARREHQIKKLTRSQKMALIQTVTFP